MKLNVGSKNQTKIQAVIDAVQLYPDIFKNPEVVGVDVQVEEVSHPKNYNAEQKKEYYEKIKHISWGGKMIKLADFTSHLKKFIGAFTGENNLPKFTYNEYCLYIRSFLESCDDSPAKAYVTELNDRLDAYIVGSN